MANVLTFPLVATALLPCMPTGASADYRLCNEARFPFFAAFAYEHKERGWASIGWFEVRPRSCENVITGSLKGRVFYVVVEGADAEGVKLLWPREASDSETFCVGQEHGYAFLIYRKELKGSCEANGYGERRFGSSHSEDREDATVPLHWQRPLAAVEEKQLGPKDYFWECGSGGSGCPKMMVVPAGEFMMGSEDKEPGRRAEEGPRHKVTMRQPFAVAERWVSRAEFGKFVEATNYKVGDKCLTWKDGKWSEEAGRSFRNPGFAQDDGDPAVCVNLDDAKAYVAWLSKQSGRPYRLPSEAECEYEMRAGTTTPFWWGATITTAQANYNGNLIYPGGAKGEFRQRTVSSAFEPNAWGIYGLGNAAEWTEDCWNASYEGAPADGSARTSGNCSMHAVRGGSWASDPAALRSAARAGVENVTRRNDLGFRVARPLAR